ncbi:hypothetical protein QEH59_06425 [Coraliomargarita sp. SDUM461004]|uniref:Uncharacterized protein n=2 Tax=Thalassobacterium sedimentorum TaxID=3041258 RepID=A0ABU1AGU6_9BACT|nr:hypothetical protein [Coraliomargarita sp. SDUM461004]
MLTLGFSALLGTSLEAQTPIQPSTKEIPWVEREIAVSLIAVDLIQGYPELFLLDPLEQPINNIKVKKLAYGRPFACNVYDGVTRFGIEDGVDEKGQKKFKTVATISVPENITQAAIFLIPGSTLTGGSDHDDHYKFRILDASRQVFPLAQTMVLNLLPTQIILKIGEEKRAVPNGEIVMIEEISQLDSYNMADISFFYQAKDQWNILKQSKIRYLPSIRYTAIAYFNTQMRKPTIVFVRDGGRVELRRTESPPSN